MADTNKNGTNGTALATRETVTLAPAHDAHAFEPRDYTQLLWLSKVMASSGLMPRGLERPESIAIAVMMGRELGLPAMKSVRSIHVIEGKPTLSSSLIVALVKRSPLCQYFQLIHTDSKVATYETHRVGEPKPTTMSFTIEQAKEAGLLTKGTWQKYAAAMLRARCETALARAVYPDLVMGLYDPDEVEEQPRRQRPAKVTVQVESKSLPEVEPPPAVTAAPVESEDVVVDAEVVSEPASNGEPDPSAIATVLVEEMQRAATEADLYAVAEKVKAAVLPFEQRSRCEAVFKERRKELKTTQPQASA